VANVPGAGLSAAQTRLEAEDLNMAGNRGNCRCLGRTPGCTETTPIGPEQGPAQYGGRPHPYLILPRESLAYSVEPDMEGNEVHPQSGGLNERARTTPADRLLLPDP
jgi:hypothetical protein